MLQHTEKNCAVFEVATRELLSGSCRHYSTEVEASGSLTEDGTGVTLEAEDFKSTISKNRYRIEGVKQHQEYVKPGLPFTDEVGYFALSNLTSLISLLYQLEYSCVVLGWLNPTPK